LSVSFPSSNVALVKLNRPEKRNALNKILWNEIGQCFNQLAVDTNCRSIVVSGNGKCFSAGIDLADLTGIMQIVCDNNLDVARKATKIKMMLLNYQSAFTAIEKCPKPVVASVHGVCLGGAMGLLTATDVRYCTSDAIFQIKEVELGLASDVGPLQRLPKIVGNESLLKELCLSGRTFDGNEALKLSLVSKTFKTEKETMDAAFCLATEIAEKSPVAVQGTKANLNYSRDHTVDESLQYMALWNMSMLQSEDLLKAASAVASKQNEPVDFDKF